MLLLPRNIGSLFLYVCGMILLHSSNYYPKTKNMRFFKTKPKRQKFSKTDSVAKEIIPLHTIASRLVDLRDKVEEDDELKIDYIFHSNSLEQSERLGKEMLFLNYSVFNNVRTNRNFFEITGKTSEMKMSYEVIKKWVEQMSDLALKHNCTFDWEINLSEQVASKI